MQIESFRVFRDLVESKSFSKAAQMNQITQSAVSQQIRAMEERFNVPLIERNSKRFSLTSEGELLYQTSKDITSSFETLQNQLDEMRDVVSGNIRLLTIYSIGLHELPPYIKAFLKEYPNVNIHVEYKRSNQVYDSILDGTADIGLVSYPVPRKGLKIDNFSKDQLVVACSPDHPFAKKKEVELSELAKQSFVGFDQDLPTRKAIDHIIDENKLNIKFTMEFDNIETVKRAIEINAGISLLPLKTVQNEIKTKTLVAVEVKDKKFYRPLGILYKSSRVLSPAMKRLLKTLSSAIEE